MGTQVLDPFAGGKDGFQAYLRAVTNWVAASKEHTSEHYLVTQNPDGHVNICVYEGTECGEDCLLGHQTPPQINWERRRWWARPSRSRKTCPLCKKAH